MLQTIREYTQGWIAGTIISIIILTFALWGIHSYFQGRVANTTVAEVNGVEISKEQLQVAYERMRRQVQNQYGANSSVTTRDESALKKRSMQSLIDIEVLKQASTAQGFLVSDRQIDNYLQSMPEFQVDGQFSLERFQETLSSTLLSTSEFLDLIKTSLLIDQPKLGLVFTSFALPDETTSTISLINQERDISYINIPIQYFLSQPIVITPQKIQAYYDKHKSEFMTPEQANVEYIVLSMDDVSKKFNPTEVMLKSFYNENINSYTQPKQWKITSIEFPVAANTSADEVKKIAKNAELASESLKKGEDITKVANQYSGKVVNMGWMSLSQAPTELQKPITDLIKVGDISKPVKNANGLIIIKATEIQETKMLTFDEAKDKVKESYIRQHAEEKFSDLRDKLADLTYEHPDSLQFAANTLSLPIQNSELFTKDKPGKDISQHKKVRDTAFSNDVMNLQNNSDVIQVNPETVVVLRIKSHVPSSLLPLNQISKQIEDKLKGQEAENRANKFSEDLLAKLQSGSDAQQLANSYKFKWNSAGLLGRYSNKVDTAILDLAFRLPNPTNAQNKTSYGVTRLPNGYAIVALKSVKPGVIADKKQASVYAEQIQNSEGLLEYELYQYSQTKNAKISVNTPA